MRRSCRTALSALLVASSACDPTGSVTDPDGNGDNVVRGLSLTAAVHLITHEVTSAVQMTVRTAIRNTTGASITVSYPLGCPVRIRLYKPPATTPAYDESRLACPFDQLGTMTIPANSTAELTSGVRFPETIRGDSLAPGPYRAAAVVQFVGDAPVEVDAGQYVLPGGSSPPPSQPTHPEPGVAVARRTGGPTP